MTTKERGCFIIQSETVSKRQHWYFQLHFFARKYAFKAKKQNKTKKQTNKLANAKSIAIIHVTKRIRVRSF